MKKLSALSLLCLLLCCCSCSRHTENNLLAYQNSPWIISADFSCNFIEYSGTVQMNGNGFFEFSFTAPQELCGITVFAYDGQYGIECNDMQIKMCRYEALSAFDVFRLLSVNSEIPISFDKSTNNAYSATYCDNEYTYKLTLDKETGLPQSITAEYDGNSLRMDIHSMEPLNQAAYDWKKQ